MQAPFPRAYHLYKELGHSLHERQRGRTLVKRESHCAQSSDFKQGTQLCQGVTRVLSAPSKLQLRSTQEREGKEKYSR